MTAQEYYDLIVEAVNCHIMPCENSAGNCLYRGSDGKKCVVGLLIPDELYYKGLEETGVRNLPGEVLFKIIPEGFSIEDLERLQEIHDGQSSSTSFARDFLSKVNDLSCFSTCKKVEA